MTKETASLFALFINDALLKKGNAHRFAQAAPAHRSEGFAVYMHCNFDEEAASYHHTNQTARDFLRSMNKARCV